MQLEPLRDVNVPNFSLDLSAYRAYSQARIEFLRTIGCDDSCRDPLSEFSERLVCQLMKGTVAPSRVQKGYDLTSPEGRRVQVKYLANPCGRWRNEHAVSFSIETDDYAIVCFEGFDVLAIIVFPRESLEAVCTALKKKHPNQQTTLQFTQANFTTVIARSGEFEKLGVICFVPGLATPDPVP